MTLNVGIDIKMETSHHSFDFKPVLQTCIKPVSVSQFGILTTLMGQITFFVGLYTGPTYGCSTDDRI